MFVATCINTTPWDFFWIQKTNKQTNKNIESMEFVQPGSDNGHAIISLTILVRTYVGVSYFVYTPRIRKHNGKYRWHLALNSTKVTEENSTFDTITINLHDDVIKWKQFPRYWPLCGEFTGPRWILRTKGQWRGALMFSLICVWINDWVNNREAGDLRRYHALNDVTVMIKTCSIWTQVQFVVFG